MAEPTESAASPFLKPKRLKPSPLASPDIALEQQPASITMPPLNEPIPEVPNSIEAVEHPLHDELATAIAFGEEPVTIMVTPSPEKFAPTYVDCWVNGKGIEVLIGNQWCEFKAIPVGKRVVTKRKYVEVLARVKQENVRAFYVERPGDDPENHVERSLSIAHAVTILHDANPKGGEWFRRIVGLQNG